ALLVNGMHQAAHVLAVLHRRQPLILAMLKLFARYQVAFDIKRVSRKLADVTMETRMRQMETLARTFVREHLVPARKTLLTVFYILGTQQFVQSISQRHFTRLQLTIFDNRHREVLVRRAVIRVLFALLVTTFQTRCEEVSRVGTDLAAEKIERVTEPEVDVLLNDVERNAAELAHVT